MRRYLFAATLFALAWGHGLRADEVIATARPVPLTRDEMKRMLEDLKSRKIRIPLPELTDAVRKLRRVTA